MIPQKTSISRLFLISMALVSLLSILSAGYLWISSEMSKFQKDAKMLRETYLEEQKSLLKIEVDRAYGFVRYMQSQTDKHLMGYLEDRVNDAILNAENINEKEKDALSVEKIEHDIQKECVNYISNITFGKDGYVFAAQYDGLSLSGPEAGKNMYDIEDVNGVKIVQELIRAAKSGGGFVNYVLPKFEGKRPAPKISYAIGVPEWKWYIGAGKYVDEIETALATKKTELDKRIRTNIRNTFFVLFALLLLIFIIVRFVSNRIRRNMVLFNGFFSQAASDASKIHKESLHFSEFTQLAESANQMVGKRLNAENALRESEKRFRDLAEMLPETIFETDSDLNLTFVNQHAYAMFGYSKEDFQQGVNGLDMIVPEDRNRASGNLTKRARGEEIGAKEYFGLRKDGSSFPVLLHTTPIISKHTFLGVRGIIIDISERKRVEEKVRESEERYRMIAENSSDFLWVLDLTSMRVSYASPSVKKITGYTPDEHQKLRLEDILTPESLKMVTKTLSEVLAKDVHNEPDDSSRLRLEWQEYHKDGHLIWVEAEMAFLRNQNGNPTGILGVSRDITERKNAEKDKKVLESQLRQAQKMEAIGTLAGGIAHDFNNILSPIVGFTEMILMDMDEKAPFREHLIQILEAAKRGSNLTKQILSFSRKAEPEIKSLDIKKLFHEVIRFIRPTLPVTIQIEQTIDESVGFVMADSTQIHQVIMNLMTNAYHAMQEDGGLLSIQLEKKELEKNDPICKELKPGPYACLTVSDTGTGIEKSIIDKIFDPYFTTKEKDRGTGLGLANALSIVKSHKGHIEVESEVGKGTVFKVYLPMLAQSSSEEQIAQFFELPKGNEYVLVVDDEKNIAELVQKILERLGYHVTTMTRSHDALDLFKQNPFHYDLLITDMTMPYMTGSHLSKEILTIRNNMPIILCTGFSDTIDKNKAKDIGIRDFLMKPVSAKSLADAVRKVLDER